MAIYQTNGRGEVFAITSVRLPRGLFDAAKDQGVNISQATADALDRILDPEITCPARR